MSAYRDPYNVFAEISSLTFYDKDKNNVIMDLKFDLAKDFLDEYIEEEVDQEKENIFLNHAMEDQNVNWDNLFHAFLKMTDMDTDEFLRAYAQRYRHDDFIENQGNEFNMHKLLHEVKEEMNSNLNSFSLDKIYTITTDVRFQNYDFNRNVFPVPLLTSDEILQFNPRVRGLEALNLRFTNTEILDDIPMSTDKAQAFIEARTGEHGFVNRDITVVVHLKYIEAMTVTIEENPRFAGGRIQFDERKDPFNVVSKIVNVLVLDKDGSLIHEFK